ncbi:MAG: penicillin-insensitive murein endopeptidase, partial [Pseudomonadota bacterium]|nr:penicillin-insensitive murein endopeptidase [Pseudomonadota bacterium]
MFATLVAIAGLIGPVAAETPAKQLFGAKAVGSQQRPAPLGSYAKGCVAGAVQLPETGPTWQT